MPIVYYLLALLLLPLAALFALTLFHAGLPSMAALGGAGAYIVVRLVVHKNIRWLEAFAHEMTHVAVALVFLRDIRELNVKSSGTGHAVTAGNRRGDAAITLAPYCLPLFTYILLALRPLISRDGTSLTIFDALAGLTLGLHLCCFAMQTRLYQTDLRRFPLPFSLLYIVTFLLFNLSVTFTCFHADASLPAALWAVVKDAYQTLIAYLPPWK